MSTNRIYRVGAAEIASALLVLAALGAVLVQGVRDTENDQAPAPAAPVSASITVDAAAAPVEQNGSAVEALGLAPADGAPEPWRGWVWLDGRRVPSECDAPEVRVLATRLREGVAVAVHNPGAAPALLRLNVRLQPGRYTIERLVFGTEIARNATIERLQCGALEARGVIRKSGYLEPGSGAVYKFVDYARLAGASYRRVAQRVQKYRAVNATQSRKLETALRECPWMITRAGALMSRKDATPALRYIHRGLLAVRHAQAVCANAGGSGQAARAGREQIADELVTLESALGECSVAALGLSPSASVEVGRSAGVPPATDAVSVWVKVRNSGPATVSAVKLWVTGPGSMVVEPSDQAVFGTLRPGQTAQAEYKVRRRSGDEPNEAAWSGILGHLSYYRDQAPAHVRIAVR